MLALDGHAVDADGGGNVQIVDAPCAPYLEILPEVLLDFIAGEEITERTRNIDS